MPEEQPAITSAFPVTIETDVTLPAQGKARRRRALARGTGVNLTANGTRILIVDDDEDIRWGLASLFEMHGAEVRTAAGGMEALRLLAERGPFHLVITDVRMPAPSGVQLVAMARTAGCHVPFFVITAYPEDPAVQNAMPQVADAVLIGKPFDPQELVQRAFTEIRSADDDQGGTDTAAS